MFRFTKKKVVAGIVGVMLIVVVLFSPLFVKAVNGEIDIAAIVANLFNKVENQDAKINDLETEIANLKEELANKIALSKTTPVIVPKETEVTPPVVTPPVQQQVVAPTPPKPVAQTPQPVVLKLQVSAVNSALKLSWTQETSPSFQGYKVVISKTNSSPSYPTDGYLKWITDRSVTSTEINNASPYNGGDFGKYLEPNTAYYFSITYVYSDKKVTTQAIQATTPANLFMPASPVSPELLQLQVSVVDDHLKLNWTAEPSESLQGYKVVISKTNPNPSYPTNGYLKWITDRSVTSTEINNSSSYNGGDFGKYLEPNTAYNFSITYVYSDKKVTTKAIQATTPANLYVPASPVSPELLKLLVSVVDDHLKLNWTAEPSLNLQGYKVVISKTNASPSYPNDGYLKWITDKTVTSTEVDNANAYNGGDIGGYLEAGTEYYFSITYVYDNAKVTTLAIKYTTPTNFPAKP